MRGVSWSEVSTVPKRTVAQAFGLELLVELGGRHLEGPEGEQRNEEEKETGERRTTTTQRTGAHAWMG